MLKQLHSVARPVKEEICHVLLTILKKKNYFIRYEVLNTLEHEFSRSRSVYDRVLFVDFCAIATQYWSTDTFTNFFPLLVN